MAQLDPGELRHVMPQVLFQVVKMPDGRLIFEDVSRGLCVKEIDTIPHEVRFVFRVDEEGNAEVEINTPARVRIEPIEGES